MKKRLFTCVIALLVLSLVSSCALAACNPKGVFPISDEMVTIKTFAPYDGDWDAENNYYLKKYREELNVNLDISYRTLTGNDAKTTISMMLASGDYPELFLVGYPEGFTMSDIMMHGVKDGTFLALNDLWAEYADNLATLHEYNPNYFNNMVAPDGNYYGVTNYSECGHCMAYPKIYFRTDWMKKVGWETMPTTTDELYEMLVAIKNGDPNGNGIADEIPLIGDVQETLDGVIMNYFLPYFPKIGDWINGSNYCYLAEDGVVHYAGLEENFKLGLKYINKLYSEGLIDVNSWSQTMDQCKTAMCTEPYIYGGASAMHYGCVIDNTITELYSNLHILLPVKSETGAQYAAYNPPINDNCRALAVITDVCEHPAEAFRLIDYMMGNDESFGRARGVNGVEWKFAEPGQLNVRGGDYVYELVVDTNGQTDYEEDETHFFGAGPSNNTLPLRDQMSAARPWDEVNTNPTYYESRLEMETMQVEQYYYDEYVLANTVFMADDEMEEFNELCAVLNEYMINAVAQFCTGGWDIDNDWQKFQDTLKGYGVDRLIELYQQAYDIQSAAN